MIIKCSFSALGLAVLAALAFTSCETNHKKVESSGTHTMGSNKAGYEMSDKDMGVHRHTTKGDSTEGAHTMGSKPGYPMKDKDM